MSKRLLKISLVVGSKKNESGPCIQFHSSFTDIQVNDEILTDIQTRTDRFILSFQTNELSV